MNIQILSLFALVFVLIMILVKSADLIEDAFVFIARKIGINEFFIGFVILSAISSLPEFSIALNSNSTIPQLSVGNLLGGTLILLTLVVGLAAIRFKEIHFIGKFRESEVLIGLGIIAMGLVTIIDSKFTLLEGLVLIFAYISYAIYIFYRFNSNPLETLKIDKSINAYNFLQMLSKAVLGAILILVASSLLVDTIIEIGKIGQINEALIGLFILAFGTNMPELAILYAARNPEFQKVAIGNTLGSAIINIFILGILGLTSRGFVLAFNDYISIIGVIVILTITLFTFAIFSWTGRTLTRKEGIILIGLYASLIITELIIAGVSLT